MTASPQVELRSSLPRSASGSRAAQGAADPAGKPPANGDATAEPVYSIRVATAAGACAHCGEPTGTGPVGYDGDRAICDLCFLQRSKVLGMVLALIAVTRACASVELTSSEDRRRADAELGAFARIYERFAARSGPARWILPRIFGH